MCQKLKKTGNEFGEIYLSDGELITNKKFDRIINHTNN